MDEIEVSRGPVPEVIRERLKLAEGEEAIVRSRRYLADGQPIETAVSYIPLDLAEGTRIAEQDTGPRGIYARLEEAGHRLARFTEEVSARMPTADERRRLQLGGGTPVLTMLRTAYSIDGPAVEVCDTVKAAPAYVLEYDFPAR